MTSSSVVKLNTAARGPNVSSVATRISSVTCVITCGGKKFVDESAFSPNAKVAPFSKASVT